MDGSCSDDSGIEEERAGGGPGPASRGPACAAATAAGQGADGPAVSPFAGGTAG